MSTLHFWFRSGAYSLMGHFDGAGGEAARLGAVLVPPFGWEEVCSYRPLKFVAKTLAEAGIPTLRYDLPGAGDSSGDPRDPGLLESWIRSVADAESELRRLARFEEVAVVGIHMGATLALAAASRTAHFQNLVLWGAAAKGRTLLRELRAAANVERGEYLRDEEAPPQTIPGFQTGGFLISPETLQDLEDLDLTTIPPPQAGRILMLSRDHLPHDPHLAKVVRHPGISVELATGTGYAAMMGTPQDAVLPEETTRRILEFLGDGTGAVSEGKPATQTQTASEAGESIYTVQAGPQRIFGVLAEPPPDIRRRDYCVLYLNVGGVRHTGPNRCWVESARRWSAQGLPSLRLDLTGIGESEGPAYLEIAGYYQTHFLDEIQLAMDSLRRDLGVRRFILVGLCSGACWGFHAALRCSDLAAAVLVNPMVLYWDPEAGRRHLFARFGNGLAGLRELARVVRGSIQRGYFTRAVRRVIQTGGRPKANQIANEFLQLGFGTVAEAWAHLERAQKKVTLILRAGEPLLAELEAAGQLPPAAGSFVRFIRIPNTGHTFRPLWAQKLLHELIDAEIAQATGLTPPPYPPELATVTLTGGAEAPPTVTTIG